VEQFSLLAPSPFVEVFLIIIARTIFPQ